MTGWVGDSQCIVDYVKAEPIGVTLVVVKAEPFGVTLVLGH